MYYILFEDGDNTPSSRLLKKSYNGSNIYFNGGNGTIKKQISDMISEGKRVF